MSSDGETRLETELELLEAMYPGQIAFKEKSREVKYSSEKGSFELRLPDRYLVDEIPEVISARSGRIELRQTLKQHIAAFNPGEEILDSIISYFQETLEFHASKEHAQSFAESKEVSEEKPDKVTIVVWLHHLLNTNKRKQALSPPSPGVCGITKPGYPGVLVYAGSTKAVHEHVNELKKQNWQAFQVRLEVDEEWSFSHGKGVKEVEAMKEVVSEIEEDKRTLFMEAMRMK